jgi:hypothetical protein
VARDPRFVAAHRGGTLELVRHREVARWAADCAEHVLQLFARRYPHDERPRLAIETARAWSRGEVGVGEARAAALAAHGAAREASDAAAREAARAAGHAVATAHMADHCLGAAAYALRAADLASGALEDAAAADRERAWQLEHLPQGVLELVLSAYGGAVSRRSPEEGVVTDRTVAQKAHVKPGTTIAVLNEAAGVVESLGLPDGITFVGPGEAQLVFLFVNTRAELEARMPPAVAALAPKARMWVFYRKGAKAAGLDMSRDAVWAVAERLGMRPLGLVGVDDTWSAFRLRPA